MFSGSKAHASLYLDFEGGIERHTKVLALCVLSEHLLPGLLEQRGVEGVAHDHVTPGEISEVAHLVQAHLVEGTSVDVNGMPIFCSSFCQGLKVLRYGGGGGGGRGKCRE